MSEEYRVVCNKLRDERALRRESKKAMSTTPDAATGTALPAGDSELLRSVAQLVVTAQEEILRKVDERFKSIEAAMRISSPKSRIETAEGTGRG